MDPRWIEPLIIVALVVFFGIVLCLITVPNDKDPPSRGGGMVE